MPERLPQVAWAFPAVAAIALAVNQFHADQFPAKGALVAESVVSHFTRLNTRKPAAAKRQLYAPAQWRVERALITEYQASVDELLQALRAGQLAGDGDAALYALAVEIARIPEQIRGFGHVKARHLGVARQNWQDQISRFHGLVAPHTMLG